MLWSEVGSGIGEQGSIPEPLFPRSVPPGDFELIAMKRMRVQNYNIKKRTTVLMFIALSPLSLLPTVKETTE